jgi:acyl carrier protein phosphodiesterase
MNHLAHFALSGTDEDIIIGNFIADFITNKELPHYSEGIQRGIQLHREIDSFTDTHPIVKQSTKRLHPFHHKYAPVIVDIYYDFLLAKNWEQFYTPLMAQPRHITQGVTVFLQDFVNNMYKILKKRQLELPVTLQKRLPYMIKNNWLMSYTHVEGLHQTFLRIEKNAAFPGNFGNAAHHLEQFLDEFDAEFKVFFPELKTHVKPLID